MQAWRSAACGRHAIHHRFCHSFPMHLIEARAEHSTAARRSSIRHPGRLRGGACGGSLGSTPTLSGGSLKLPSSQALKLSSSMLNFCYCSTRALPSIMPGHFGGGARRVCVPLLSRLMCCGLTPAAATRSAALHSRRSDGPPVLNWLTEVCNRKPAWLLHPIAPQ